MSRRIRGHFLIIFEGTSIWPFLSILLVPLFFGFTGRKLNISDLVFYIIVFWFNSINRFFRYLFTFYTTYSDHILIETGIINKRKTEIPFGSVTTIDLSQNIVQRLFNVYKIKLDNASQSNDLADKSEVTIVLGADEAFQFREIVLKQKGEYSEPEIENIELQQDQSVKATFSDFLILGALRSKSAYFATMMPIIIGIAVYFISLLTGVKDEKDIYGMVFGNSVILPAAILILVIYVSSFVFSIVKSIITYYGFRIISGQKTIDVEYGLFVKKKYSLSKTKINGIIIRQNLLMQIFGYCSIDVCVIGYGDKSDQANEGNGMLFPITTQKKALDIINTLLQGFDVSMDIEHPPKRAMRYFFIRPLPIITAAALTGALFTQISWLILLFVMFLGLTLLNSFVEYKNSGISLNENTVTVSSGGFIKRKVLVNFENIESISAASSYFKKRRNIASLEVRFMAPLRNSTVQVMNLDISNFRELENRLTY